MSVAKNKMDFRDANEIQISIYKMEKIIDTNIFSREDLSCLQESVFCHLMILLRDLMYKCEKYARRIDFNSDIEQTSYYRKQGNNRTVENIVDVSDLIKYIRDAVCHVDSLNHYIHETDTSLSFVVVHGKCTAIQQGDLKMASDYEDDIRFFYGDKGIYLNRHIKKALEEAKNHLAPLISNPQLYQSFV